jgi:hypothetical protein
MSHDPSHWDYEIKNHEKNFHPVNGMQFGDWNSAILWSLAQYAYAQGGLYENLGRYVYVNRGLDLRLPR